MEIIDLSKPIYYSTEAVSIINKKDNYKQMDNGQFQITLMYFDLASRNNNRYPMVDFLRGIKDNSRIKEQILNNILFGEAEHPFMEKMTPKRLFHIDPDNVVWRIVKIWVEGSTLQGIVQWAQPKGDTYRRNVEEHDMNIAASVRSFTPTVIKKTINGQTILDKVFPLYPITWDAVKVPGFVGTRAKGSEFEMANASNFGIESIQDGFIENPAEDIMELINDVNSTESAQILGDLYNFDVNNADIRLVGDNMLQIRSKADGINIISHANTVGLGKLIL